MQGAGLTIGSNLGFSVTSTHGQDRWGSSRQPCDQWTTRSTSWAISWVINCLLWLDRETCQTTRWPLTNHNSPSLTTCVMSSGRRCQLPTTRMYTKKWRPKRCDPGCLVFRKTDCELSSQFHSSTSQHQQHGGEERSVLLLVSVMNTPWNLLYSVRESKSILPH